MRTDDRSTRARIRDAAIAVFAEEGVAATTARKVAAEAGVSAGSVINHFGSMEQLRHTCDEHVAEVIRQGKQEAMAQGPSIDILAALRHVGEDFGPLLGYLARVLTDDSRAVNELVDNLVADAEQYLADGVDSGLIQPSEDPHGRAVVLALWSLGALTLHRHLERLLDVDLTDPGVAASPAMARYAGPAYELLGGGLLAQEFATKALAAFRALAQEAPPPPTQGGAGSDPRRPT